MSARGGWDGLPRRTLSHRRGADPAVSTAGPAASAPEPDSRPEEPR